MVLPAALSVVFWGTSNVPYKIAEKYCGGVEHPIAFGVLTSSGAGLGSLCAGLVAALVDPTNAFPPVVNPFGVVAGVMIVGALVSAIFAIERLGLGPAYAIWGGLSVLVAYLVGRIAFGESGSNDVAAGSGVGLLLIGVISIAMAPLLGPHDVPGMESVGLLYHDHGGVQTASDSSKRTPSLSVSRPMEGQSLLVKRGYPVDGRGEARESSGEAETYARLVNATGSITSRDPVDPLPLLLRVTAPPPPTPSSGRIIIGLLTASLVGVLGGLLLVPAHYIHSRYASGIGYTVSLGVGALSGAAALAIGLATGMVGAVGQSKGRAFGAIDSDLDAGVGNRPEAKFTAVEVLEVGTMGSSKSGTTGRQTTTRVMHPAETMSGWEAMCSLGSKPMVLGLGLTSGLLWSAGNLSSLLAMYGLPYSVSFPVGYTALAVGVAVGILCFDEVPGVRARIVFLAGVGATIAGACLLGIYGTKR